MRIFVATGIFHPEPGGPATYLMHLLPELQARGHDVSVLTYGDGPLDGYPYPLTRISRTAGFAARQFAYWRAAARLWPGHDIAFIHTLGLPLPANTRPRVAKIVGDKAWERSVNRGWIPPAADIDAFRTRRYGPLAEISKTWRAWEARRLDHIIVPSSYMQAMVTGWGVSPQRVSVVVNAPHRLLPDPGCDRSAARERLGLPDAPTLLTVARLTPWKGVDHLLRALPQLDPIRLLVAGDGPQMPALTALASEHGVSNRAVFLGQVPHERLATYYRAADFTILYSGYEGMSHVLLESLGLGTPVIASDKGGNREVVQHGVNGLLAPYPDPAALVETIRAAFEPRTHGTLNAHARSGLDRFDWTQTVQQTITILEQVAGG